MQTLFTSRGHRPGILCRLMSVTLLLAAQATYAGDPESDRAQISALLDDFHAAAAAADRDRYLGHFAPNGVFMGTDDWERWPLAEFTSYVEKRFSDGGGWRYESEERHMDFSADGNTAWFDEIMVNTRWGRFRGTGVLLRLDGAWKLAHYSLTALVPNENFEDVSRIATKGFATREKNNEN